MSRWSLGTALFGGYLISTVLSLFLVPILYVMIKQLEEQFLKPRKPGGASPSGNASQPKSQVPQEGQMEGSIPAFRASSQPE